MSTRLAMREALTFVLKNAMEEGKIDLTEEQVETVVLNLEDNPDFHGELEDAVVDHVEMFGENYGIEW